MIITGFDLESTGLDIVKDRPIEVAVMLWSTRMNRAVDSQAVLIQADGVPVTEEITEITGITQAAVDKFGYEPASAFEVLASFISQADAIATFNGNRFDIPMSKEWAKRVQQQFPEKLHIDLSTDLPMRSQELITMCAKKGFLYPAHEALGDVGGMMKLMSMFPFEVVLQRAQSPMIVVQSKQGRNENNKAKRHKFRWNPDLKIWWKAIKEMDFGDLVKAVNNEFGLQVRSDFTPEMLETE
jgi:DNA polymerase III alpha subunit (gram-positive type)